jgi:copper chaperone CopZ
MKSETLSLSAAVTQANIADIERALGALQGVNRVAVAIAANAVKVDFDDDATSLAELRTVLKKAGFETKKPAYETGMCCGSCGS